MIVNREMKENEAQYMIYNTSFKYQFNTKANKIIDNLLMYIFSLKYKKERWY